MGTQIKGIDIGEWVIIGGGRIGGRGVTACVCARACAIEEQRGELKPDFQHFYANP